MTILAVDDSSGVRAFYEAVLGMEGYDVRTARDGMAALDELRACRPDLILLDVRLPYLSGWDILRIVRASAQWADIPVVVASVMHDARSLAYGWAMDCTWYLPKPMRADDLLLLVRRLLGEAPLPAHPQLEQAAVQSATA
jgi:DNA-binding response OmpR family regulator